MRVGAIFLVFLAGCADATSGDRGPARVAASEVEDLVPHSELSLSMWQAQLQRPGALPEKDGTFIQTTPSECYVSRGWLSVRMTRSAAEVRAYLWSLTGELGTRPFTLTIDGSPIETTAVCAERSGDPACVLRPVDGRTDILALMATGGEVATTVEGRTHRLSLAGYRAAIDACSRRLAD